MKIMSPGLTDWFLSKNPDGASLALAGRLVPIPGKWPWLSDKENFMNTLIARSTKFPHSETADATTTISKIGLWSAILTVLCSAGYGIAVIALLVSSLSIQSSSQAEGWTGIESFIVAFTPIQMLPVIPSLFLAPAFTALMVSIHSYAAEDKKIWSLLGLAFTLIYATIATMNYMIQLLPVWRSINHGEMDGMAMFVGGNPHSIFWGLAYVYIFMNLAMLFTAPVFGGNRLENRIRLLFILNGISGILTLTSAFLDSVPFYLIGSLLIWCPIFTAATASVAVLFDKTIKARRRL
jgi:hypothetical protein